MRRPDHLRALGYPATASGIRYRAHDDFDGMVDHLDETMALAVDAVIDDLPLNERTAVHAVIIGPMVWRFRDPVQDVYGRARDMIKVALTLRGID